MLVTGTIGATSVTAEISAHKVSFPNQKKINEISPLKIVCFQRINKKLKTCDIVYIDVKKHVAIEQTISKDLIDSIRDELDCAIYMMGADPLPWKRFVRDAKKYKWTLDDWQYLFEASSSSESDSAQDSDWTPDESASEDSEDSEDDEEDKPEPPTKRLKVST